MDNINLFKIVLEVMEKQKEAGDKEQEKELKEEVAAYLDYLDRAHELKNFIYYIQNNNNGDNAGTNTRKRGQIIMADLRNVKEFKATEGKFYTAKLHKGGKVFNITFFCNDNNLIVHEWYKMSREELETTTKELNKYFVGLAA